MAVPHFSVVIPCYNEGEDLRLSLDASLNQDWPDFEVIVVDDASADGTGDLLRFYAAQQPRLKVLTHPVNRGVASARNTGIRSATGDIVVILNADVSPAPDFLRRLSAHYEAGADWVLVESEVSNQSSLYPRFVEAYHHYNYDNDPTIVWTEGFSCRRTAALEVGLFPERIPGCGGEDAVFGRALLERHRRVIDKSIVVRHVAPATLRAFWNQRVSRGRGAAFTQHHVHGRSLLQLGIRFALKLIFGIAADLEDFPHFFAHYLRRPQAIHKGWTDAFPFLWAAVVQTPGHRWGEWSGWFRLLRDRR